MQVLVDGVIFQKDPHGGVARIYDEILPRMCDLDPGLRITLFIDGPLRRALPEHPQISVRKAPPVKRNLRAWGLWRKVLFPFRRLAGRAWSLARGAWLGSGEGTIWHSTYYTTPNNWRGRQVVTVYDLTYERYTEYYSDPIDEVARRQHQRCIAQADAVICISEATKQDVLRFYAVEAEGKLHVIPLAASVAFNPLSEAEQQTEWRLAGLGKDEAFLLYVGSRFKYKNFDALLDAYSLWSGRQQARLVAVGAPWREEEIRRLEALGIAGRVILLSDIDDQTLRRLYNRALAFVFPSLYEGFGIPLLEALACGCPLIAAPIPSTREVAGECARYFDPEQPDTLIAALDEALAGMRTPESVQQGIRRAAQFSWQRTAEQTLQVYRSLYG